MTTFSWTDDRVAQLKKLFEAGLSASEIAVELGGVTRNAVIGALHRRGLFDAARVKPAGTIDRRPGRQAARARQARQPRMVTVSRPIAVEQTIVPPPPRNDAQIPLDQRRDLAGLDAHCCHWPVGHPGTEGFFFCGAPVLNFGEPYCASHMHRATASNQPRRRSTEGARVDGWR